MWAWAGALPSYRQFWYLPWLWCSLTCAIASSLYMSIQAVLARDAQVAWTHSSVWSGHVMCGQFTGCSKVVSLPRAHSSIPSLPAAVFFDLNKAFASDCQNLRPSEFSCWWNCHITDCASRSSRPALAMVVKLLVSQLSLLIEVWPFLNWSQGQKQPWGRMA